MSKQYTKTLSVTSSGGLINVTNHPPPAGEVIGLSSSINWAGSIAPLH
ncbi:MAG TPA: hypothetical protein VF222_13115 [Nitrososphaeraceae archaeon]